MGVYHFMGVGFSVGVVTCAVDYIEQALELNRKSNRLESIQRLFKNSGGHNHSEQNSGSIEALVLFSSSEVINRQKKAYSYIGNKNPSYVRDEINQQLKNVWRSYDQQEGRKVFWCELDIDNFQECFNRIIDVTYRFAPPHKQGKEIWCNLTGGTNSISLALTSMVQLTSRSTVQYLISQRNDYREFVQVPPTISINPNRDNYFNTLPFIKTAIDTVGLFSILMDLEKKPMKSKELYSRFQQEHPLSTIDESIFVKTYLLKLYGLSYIERDEDENNTITDVGEYFLNNMDNLSKIWEMEDRLKARDLVEESKTWSWMTEDNLDK